MVSERFNPSHPDLVSFLEVQESANPPTHVELRHFHVDFLDSVNNKIGPTGRFSVEYTAEQDVLDLLAFFRKDRQIFGAVNETIRPALAARRILGAPDAHSGKLWELPGSYIRISEKDSSIEEAIARTLEKKVGCTPKGDSIFLGGSYFPSVGGSTELCFPRAQEIETPALMRSVRYGQTFGRSQQTWFLPLQQMLDNYLTGQYQDMRLAECIMRMMRHEGITPVVDLDLSTITKDLKFSNLEKLASYSDILSEIARIKESTGTISQLHVTQIAAPTKPFMQTRRISVNNRNNYGHILDSYEADLVVRNGLDSIDIGAYYFHDGNIRMPVKLGVRPAIAVRNLSQHPVHSDMEPIQLEGVAGSLRLPYTFDSLVEQIGEELAEEVGLALVSRPVFVTADFPSGGHNPEKTFRVLAEVDPSKRVTRPQGVDETVNEYHVEPETILQLADQGIVRDPRLSLDAHLLSAAFPDTTSRKVYSFTPFEKEFAKMINSGSHVQKWLSRKTHHVDLQLHKSVHYRRLKAYCENELGLVVTTFDHPDEKHFFSPSVPLFALPDADDPRKLPFYLLHDLRHYTTGEFVPFTRSAGGILTPISDEDFRLSSSGDECEAVWFSDVVIPTLFGLDEAEKIFGGMSVARAFDKMGFGQEDSRKIITSIERDGTMPDSVLKHPLYKELRPVLVDRLLRYHIMDSDHTKIMYGNWISKPHVASAAIRFGKNQQVFTDAQEYRDFFQVSLERVLNYTEGINPLRASISRTINNGIRVSGLYLAHLQGMVEENGRTDAPKEVRNIETCLSGLDKAYAELSLILPTVKDIEMNTHNLDVYELLKETQANYVDAAKRRIAHLLTDSPALTDAQKADHKDRQVPFFRDLAVLDKNEVLKKTYELERVQLERVGITL